jgi:N6-adenosine-specific RNA methylase IME4
LSTDCGHREPGAVRADFLVELRGPARSNDLKTLVCPTGQKPVSEQKSLSPPLSNRGADERAEANQAYGALTESLHIAGYTLERAFRSHLEPLIAGEAWRRCGPGFDDINAFMDSLRLDKFRLIADERKQIVARIRELQPKVTNRQIARTLGVDEGTVRNDAAENSANGRKSINPISVAKDAAAEKSAPLGLTGEEAAKRVIRFEEAPAKRAERRAERLRRIVDRNPPLPTGRRWPVIYADPPWRWETWSRETGLDRAPEAHYDTMTIEEIMALDVPSIAADDCVLFLWATSPLLLRAGRDVMEGAWKFTYKTSIYWPKNKAATGYCVRGKHELLLIGTRGAIPAPLPGQQGESIIETPDLVELIERGDSMAIEASVGAHSAKPAAFAELIERWFPDPVPKIELFHRGAPRPGWAAWGNEAEAAEGDRSVSPPGGGGGVGLRPGGPGAAGRRRRR